MQHPGPQDPVPASPVPASPPRDGRRILARVAASVLGVAVLTLLVAGVGWRLVGGQWAVVATPSMGQAAPVGSLVLTKPVPVDRIAVGDVVTFHPRNATNQLSVTHRVVGIDRSSGSVEMTTRGDANGADDPGRIGGADLVGRVEAIGWGLGWLVKALPLLLVGGATLWWATGLWAGARWRIPLRVAGGALLVSTASLVLRPFIGVISRGSTPTADGTEISLISTGLLPTRISAPGGDHLDLVAGQSGSLSMRLPPGTNGVPLSSGPHLSPLMWVVMSALWLTPMIIGLAADRWSRPSGPPDTGPAEPVTEPLPPAPHAPRSRIRRVVRRPLAAALAVGVVMTVGLAHVPTMAAFQARVTNTANTAASNAYFTCLAAQTAAGTGPYLVWPLDANTTAQRDVSGNNRTATVVTPASTQTSRPCLRDTGTTAVNLTGGYVATTSTTAVASPTTFSIGLWFRTSTTTGGRMIGFGAARTGDSATKDRHVYMTNAGRLVFGINPSTRQTVTSPLAYNDGQWHQVVATFSPTTGMALHVDGERVAANAAATTAGTNYTGFWRVGDDDLTGWVNRPATDTYQGGVAWAAVHTTVLSATQIRQNNVAGE